MEFVIAWVTCSILAFFVFVSDWRRDWDVHVGDAITIAIISALGPFGLIASLVVWISGITRFGDKVIWRRK